MLGLAADAAEIRFITPPNTSVLSDGSTNPVSGNLTIITGLNTVTVKLSNPLVDPANVGQNISGVFFKLTDGGSGAVTNASGEGRNVYHDGTWTPQAVTVAWALQVYMHPTAGRGLLLCAICPPNGVPPEQAPNATQTLLGNPGAGNIYRSANGSIKMKPGETADSHNPFLAGTVTWNLAVSGVQNTTGATRANFFYGTTFGPEVDADMATPEPAVLFMFGSGLVLIGALRHRRKSRKGL